MNVLPGVLPVLNPIVDLRVVFPEAPPKIVVLHARAKRKTAPVEACVFFVNDQVYACAETVNSSVLTQPRLDAPPPQALSDHIPP